MKLSRPPGTDARHLNVTRWEWAMMRDLGFEPHPGQMLFYYVIQLFRKVFCAAGRRGGKSLFLAVLIWLQWMRSQWTLPDPTDPFQWPRKVLLVAPQEDQLDIIFDQVAGFADERGVPLDVDRRSAGHKQLRTPWGSIFRGMTGKNPRAGRGYAWQWIFGDEAPHVDYPRKLYYEVLFPTLADARGNFVAIGTPDAPGSLAHKWKLMGEDPDNGEWGFVTWESTANWHMPWLQEEIQAMIDAGVPVDIIDREWRAKFVQRAGVVYEQAQECVMDAAEAKRVEPLLKNATWHRFIDFGFTNPFACLVVALLGETWYVWDEYYRARRTLQEHAPVLLQMDARYGFKTNICDPSEPGSIRTLAKWRDPETGKRIGGGWILNFEKPPVIDSIDAVRAKMGMGHVRIHPRCRELIKEYGMECYPEPRAMMNYSENPVDANNHGTSAFRYGNWYYFKKVTDIPPPLESEGRRESDKALVGYDA